MDYKLDYIARLFRCIQNKRFESYVIQRIWHKLDDPEIRFVSQQYFKRKDTGRYALADLYLPQFKLVVEIDEGQHANTVSADLTRSAQIVDVSDSEVLRIPIFEKVDAYGEVVWKTLDEVNRAIDDVVGIIKQKKAALGPGFIPWSGDILSVEYHQKKGCFSVSNNDYIRTIDDAAAVFNTKAKHKGYLRAGGFDVPGKSNMIVWCPSVSSLNWENILLENGLTILESKINSTSDERIQHYMEYYEKNEQRVTFYKAKDSLGYYFYRFIGVFKVDLVRSVALNKTVWTRVSDEYVIQHGYDH